MPTPTLLLLTANDPDMRLHRLADEANEIQRLLNSAGGRQYEVASVHEASAREIVSQLRVPDREVEVIHYAGHAGQDQLMLTDGNADAEALAERIRLLGTVKLVFLNGCATKSQVLFFHKAGVPFVIATSRPIEDEKAFWVAKDLYQYLTLGRTIQDAFETMAADQKFKKEKVKLVLNRSAGRQEWDAEEDLLPWGLYVKEGAEGHDYSLPISRPKFQVSQGINHTVFLDELIFSLGEVNSPALDPIRQLGNTIRMGGNPSEKYKSEELPKYLPSPLAIRLRQIFADPEQKGDKYYRELLYDYASFFEMMLHMQLSLLLAQIWDNKAPAFAHPPVNLDRIKGFLCQDRLKISPAAFAEPLESLSDWIQDAGIEGMETLSEGQKNYLRSGEFQQAADFFFLHKQYFWQRLRLKEEESIENCLIAQPHILKAFSAFNRLVQNTLASVGGFTIINMRYVLPKVVFNHVASLAGESANYQPVPGEETMENKSILCFPDQNRGPGNRGLNLFPLIIDRNVFAQESVGVDLYLFLGYFKEEGEERPCFYFSSVNDPAKIWKFEETQNHLNFLHLGETAETTHQKNHLIVNSGEMKRYLGEFKKLFLNP